MSAADAPDTALHAARARRRALLRFAVVAALVVLDLWTKSVVFAWLDPASGGLPEGVELWRNGHWRYPVLGDFLGLMLSTNTGAAWGAFSEHPEWLVAGRGIAVLVLGWLVWRAKPGQRVVNAALVLVLAGALGNLYDNLFQPRVGEQSFGAVRDFVSVYFSTWDYHFPTFNVADACISVGAVLLLVSGFLPGAGRERAPEAAADGGGARPEGSGGSAKL